MADVTMDLSELDNMRNEISSLKEQVKDLEGKQKLIKIEAALSDTYLTHELRTQPIYDSYGRHDRWAQKQFYEPVKKAIRVNSVVFVGLDTVKENMKLDAQQAVQDDIYSLTSEISSLKDKIRALQDSNNKKEDVCKAKIIDLGNKHDNQIKELKTAHAGHIEIDKEIILKLRDDITVLKKETLERTKDQKIANLEKEIERLRKKRWYSWFTED